jgi:hypothetical protein
MDLLAGGLAVDCAEGWLLFGLTGITGGSNQIGQKSLFLQSTNKTNAGKTSQNPLMDTQ